MKRGFFLVYMLVFIVCAVPVHAETNAVVVAAVQTESILSTDDEYILLVNTADTSVNVTGWHVQYFSASAADFKSPSRNVLLSGIVAAKGTLLLAAGSATPNATFSAGMASAGGHVRVVSGSGITEVQHDLIGWGTASHPETAAVSVAAKGQVYSRKKTTDGQYIDTNNNSDDFSNGSSASTVTPSMVGTEEPIPTEAALQITELLPNPASPQTDADDEFVELYNPTNTAVDLKGYKVQTGNTYSYSYTFAGGTLAPGEYKAFYALQTNLTLSNTSGKARLLSASGNVLSETSPYASAASGASWALSEGGWAWVAAPSPDMQTPNISGAVVTSNANAAPNTKTKTSASKTKVAGVTNVKTPATKAAKTTVTTDKKTYQNPSSDNKPLPMNPFVLVGVGSIAVGYMIYEYRDVLANRIARIRRNRASRRTIGS